ncbi:cadherin-like domain-containing protein, partial [Polynucleobacter sp. AP-Capit-er-40B-B4]|uniref:Ig-like domain-containing protein n=1 Tax=Polynucleobacter sp. AP-Capit-er-40B-B4 TaxID=2576927 RepID=UPI001C0BBCB4
ITPVNDIFTDAPETVTTPEDTAKSGNLLTGTTSVDGPVTVSTFTVAGVVDGSGNPVVFTVGATAQTIPGVGTITIAANGDYTFTPAANYHGTVPTISYALTDGLGADVVSTLDITVSPVVDLTAANDTNTTPEDTPVNGTVVANDSTTSGGTLAYAKAT